MKKIFMILAFLPILVIAQDMHRYIDVTGTAEILAQSDCIEFRIDIKTVADNLEGSRKQNNNASDDLIKIISEFKIEKDDWELSPIKFGKEYSYNRNERDLIGYYSQTTIVVKLRQLRNYYDFINQLSKNSKYEITSSNYGVSDILKYHKQATIEAVKAAKEKAEYIAESMGVKVGKILQITEENVQNNYPTPFNSIAKIGGGNSEISGKVAFTRSVNLRIEIIE